LEVGLGLELGLEQVQEQEVQTHSRLSLANPIKHQDKRVRLPQQVQQARQVQTQMQPTTPSHRSWAAEEFQGSHP
jgi:hypothetical protein